MKQASDDKAAKLAAKDYMGSFAWPTVLLCLVAVPTYWVTPVLVYSELLNGWVALLIMSLAAYLSYTVLHESVHGSIAGGRSSLRWVNEWCGYLAATVMAIPLTAHRHEHLAHHRHTNQPNSDPDHHVANLLASPLAAVRVMIQGVATQYTYYFKHRWSAGHFKQNTILCVEIGIATGLRLLMLFINPWVSLALFLGSAMASIWLIALFFAFLVHKPYDRTGRYVDTGVVIAPAGLNAIMTRLWLFQNYHAIHHLFPRVPFYQYQRLFNRIEPAMRANGTPIRYLGAADRSPASHYSNASR